MVTEAKGYPKIDYSTVFDRLPSIIRQLEEEHVEVVSKIDLNTNKLVEGEFELLLNRSKILTRQENYAIAFVVDAKNIQVRLLREVKRIIFRSIV